uniref:ABC transporter domain-containing protein n=3 Tax=Clastoptera arizonana TaxID=38151 RepID=A0A1B6EFI2_9HEMI
MYFLKDDLHIFDSKLSSWIISSIHYIFCLNPYYALIRACMDFGLVSFINGMCDQCPERVHQCTRKLYFSIVDEHHSFGIYLIYLSIDWILYYALIVSIDLGYLSIIRHNLKDMRTLLQNIDLVRQDDADVKDERDRVDAFQNTNTDQTILTTLTANRLVKIFGKVIPAVKGVSFQVAQGECFGLLGVNGAGKTTTFRMLTGDEIPTSGEASIFNYKLSKDRNKYLMQTGYCPQFDGINEMLTGEEMLTMFALLRGISPKSVKYQVDNWINLLGLEEYCKRLCGGYSGGNKRKLCTAIALIGDPPVVFLDEPTSGVDPISRRNLWDVLGQSQRSGQAVVLTSHSMEECEALCTRLTIMVQGQMMCIGSTQYIKQKYGQGYTVMIKLANLPNIKTSLTRLKHDMKNTFSIDCVLKDEHLGLLHYHLTDNRTPLSTIFQYLEHLKHLHSIVEDYTISNTTLEQVFIAFAKREIH